MATIKHFNGRSLIPVVCSLACSVTATGSATEQNYAEALQKSVFFYDIQRSGELPRAENNYLANDWHSGFLPNRVEWRSDSYTEDGLYDQNGNFINIDLTGGWNDAGDHVKFGLPMSFSASVLGWGVWEFWDAYEQSGQLPYALDNLRWVSDYFVKAHTGVDEFYAQVGHGDIDHSLWAPPEVQWLELKRLHGVEKYRPALKLDMENPGADLVAQTAAALAISSLIFEKNSVNNPADADYAQLLLKHAEELFAFAYKTKDFDHYGADNKKGAFTNSMIDDHSDYNYALNFYNSGGAADEIPWAAAWLYLATQKAEYLNKAEITYTAIADNTGHFAWYPAWDDIRNAVYYVMADIKNLPSYSRDTKITDDQRIDGYFDYELHSHNYVYELLNNKKHTPGGMIYLDGFASARAAAMASMVALVHRNYLIDNNKQPTMQAELAQFATEQMNYILGDNPHNLSYVVGYSDNWQTAAHHRSSHGSSTNDINKPAMPVHILYGALSGGPDATDAFSTDRADFPMTEVATDMNAGLTGALAGLVGIHGGKALANFPQPESPANATGMSIEAKVGYPEGDDGKSGAVINLHILNESSLPPKEYDGVKFRYYFDMSDDLARGYSAESLNVAIYYDSSSLKIPLEIGTWGDKAGQYYIEGQSGLITPVGDEQKAAAMEIYLGNYEQAGWDYTNDPSAKGLGSASHTPAQNIVLFDTEGNILWGQTPDGAGGIVVTPDNSKDDNKDGANKPNEDVDAGDNSANDNSKDGSNADNGDTTSNDPDETQKGNSPNADNGDKSSNDPDETQTGNNPNADNGDTTSNDPDKTQTGNNPNADNGSNGADETQTANNPSGQPDTDNGQSVDGEPSTNDTNPTSTGPAGNGKSKVGAVHPVFALMLVLSGVFFRRKNKLG